MKKLIAMLLVVVLALGLFAGCANNDSGKETTGAKTPDDTKAPETTAAPEAKTEYTFYGIYKAEGVYFVTEAASTEKTLKAWGEEKGYKVNWVCLFSESDPEKCLTQVQTAVADKADCIFICVPDQSMSFSVVELCKEGNVPVVSVDDGLIDDNGNRLAPWYGIDAYNIGYAAGEWMANYAKDNNLLDDPTVGLIYAEMPTVNSCVPRTQGEKDAWAKINGEAMADRTFSFPYNADENEAYTNCMAVITAHPEITSWLVMTASETASNAAAAALEEAGLDETSCINALGGDATVPHWEEGNFPVIKSATYFSGTVVGREAAEAVINYIENGTEIPMEYATPAILITPDNYKELLG